MPTTEVLLNRIIRLAGILIEAGMDPESLQGAEKEDGCDAKLPLRGELQIPDLRHG